MGFVHLHCHSDYSLLDGAFLIENYPKAVLENGMTAVALTDHGNLFGALRFEKACRKAGVKPIIGAELYVSEIDHTSKERRAWNHMCLLCENETGYKNLLKLVSMSYVEGFYYKPRIDEALLEKYHEGLIATSACLGGIIPTLIVKGRYEEAKAKALYYASLFGPDHFYLEMQNHGLKEEIEAANGMRRIARETSIPLIVANDCHYYKKEHAVAQDVLVCIGTGKKRSETKRFKMGTQEFYFKSEAEMEALFPDDREALDNTVKIAEMCSVVIDKPGPILPEYEVPEGFEHHIDYLKFLTLEGLKKRYGNGLTPEISERAEYELGVISTMGFPGYFLIVWDFVSWAHEHGISVGPGRGSGASSLVAYALGITDVDPIKYNLLFERFLNPERVSMPDFDIDFCNERRSEVIEYVTKKYGAEHVGGIITFGTLKPKAVLKDVARVLDIPFAEANKLTTFVTDQPMPKGYDKSIIDWLLECSPEMREYEEKGGSYAELFEICRVLVGMSRHASTHACGQVIGREPLTSYVPLYKDPRDGEVSSGYTMDLIEDCGLVKMDFLGLKTLDIIDHAIEMIRHREPDFSLSNAREDDPGVYEMLGRGDTLGVFQFASSGMKSVLRRAEPSNIEEMVALNALYRPGPMQFIDQYVKSKKNEQKIQYPDPSLEGILKSTFGVIVYQEQVMQVAQTVAGFSLGKADLLRRAMGKKKIKEMERMETEFVSGATERGYSAETARSIYEILKPFAGYGFNKSHAVAYSVLAYRCAYLKVHYPVEFMAACLTNEMNSPDTFSAYLEATKHMGIKVLPPDANHSQMSFSVSNGSIYYGIAAIKGIGQALAGIVLEARNTKGSFTSLIDFCEKLGKNIGGKAVQTLAQAGFFDSIEPMRSRCDLYYGCEEALKWAQNVAGDSASGQESLFEEEEIKGSFELPVHELSWSEKEKLQMEKDVLGYYFSGHPLNSLILEMEKLPSVPFEDLAEMERWAGKSAPCVGMLTSLRTLRTKSQKKMAFGVVETLRAQVEVCFFPASYERFEDKLEEGDILFLLLSVSKRGGDRLSFSVQSLFPSISDLRGACSSVEPPESLQVSSERGRSAESAAGTEQVVTLSIDLRLAQSEQEMRSLQANLRRAPEGSAALVLRLLAGASVERELRLSRRVSASSESLDFLKRLTGVVKVQKQEVSREGAL